jgi:RNA methyltransferase, TrmH family
MTKGRGRGPVKHLENGPESQSQSQFMFIERSEKMITITSNQNPIIKEVKALKERKYREEQKLFFIEGIRFVEEALKEKADMQRILVSEQLEEVRGGREILEKVREQGTEVAVLSHKLAKEISDTENPQGIFSTIKMREYNLQSILVPGGFFVLLEGLQDPGNMGTIIRTADAAGASGIVLSKGCVDIYNPKVLRSTMGSVFHLPFCLVEDLSEAIITLRRQDIKVCAAHLKGTASYFELDMTGGIALIIGNEANGISAAVAETADMLVKIPMPGRAESLNASVAAGLLMYEVVRQRMETPEG